MSHTSPGDYVLDLPYGGGINFANGRRYPIFNVELSGLGVRSYYEQLDVDLIHRRPPGIVIGAKKPHLGAYWGFGQKGNRACPYLAAGLGDRAHPGIRATYSPSRSTSSRIIRSPNELATD